MIEGVDEEKQTGLDYQNREDEAEKRHKEAEEAARKRAEAQERERQSSRSGTKRTSTLTSPR